MESKDLIDQCIALVDKDAAMPALACAVAAFALELKRSNDKPAEPHQHTASAAEQPAATHRPLLQAVKVIKNLHLPPNTEDITIGVFKRLAAEYQGSAPPKLRNAIMSDDVAAAIRESVFGYRKPPRVNREGFTVNSQGYTVDTACNAQEEN